MLQNTSYGSKTTPPAEAPRGTLGSKSTDLLTREETGWLLSGPTLGPLSQPLGALLKGEHEKDL